MGSSAPPPSQSGIPSQGGNNTTYILLAIVLLLGIGGIVMWKMRSSDTPAPAPTQQPVASASASASAGPQNAILDDIPPPPPVEDSGPQSHVSGNSGPYDPCSPTNCYGGVKPGSDTERGLAVLSMQTRRKCYNPALGNDPTLKGKVVLRMKIAGNGQICSAAVESNTMSSSSVADCAARVLLGSGHVPAPGGNCVNLDLPLNYVPMGGQ